MTPHMSPTATPGMAGLFEQYRAITRLAETYVEQLLAWMKAQTDLMFDERAPWNYGLSLTRQMMDLAACPVAVVEEEQAYRLTAELPGVDAGKLDIRIADNTLRVSTGQPGEAPGKGEASRLTAIGFEREIRLPPDTDPEKATAECHGDMLMITLPKRPRAAAKEHKVAIKA